MRYDSWRILGISVLCLVLVGCGGADPRPAPRPPDLINALHRSMMEDQHLRAVGLDPAQDDGGVPVGQVTAVPSRPCEGKLRSDPHRRQAVQSGYSSAEVQVVQRAFSYRYVQGADVVGQLRKLTQGCESYQTESERGEATYTVRPAVELDGVDGVDAAYAYCEEGRAQHWVWWACYALLARGKVVSTVRVNAGTRKQTRTILTDLAPVAAHLLIKATQRP